MILEHCHRAECKQHIDSLNAEIARLREAFGVVVNLGDKVVSQFALATLEKKP